MDTGQQDKSMQKYGIMMCDCDASVLGPCRSTNDPD